MPSIWSHGTRQNLSGKIEVRHASPNKWRMSSSNLEQRVPSGPHCLTQHDACPAIATLQAHATTSTTESRWGTCAMERSLVTFSGIKKNVVLQLVAAISHTAQPSRRTSQFYPLVSLGWSGGTSAWKPAVAVLYFLASLSQLSPSSLGNPNGVWWKRHFLKTRALDYGKTDVN